MREYNKYVHTNERGDGMVIVLTFSVTTARQETPRSTLFISQLFLHAAVL